MTPISKAWGHTVWLFFVSLHLYPWLLRLDVQGRHLSFLTTAANGQGHSSKPSYNLVFINTSCFPLPVLKI